MSLEEILKNKLGKEIAAASDAEVYTALLNITKALLYFSGVPYRKAFIKQSDKSWLI